jgi:hypothetical protein
LLRPRHKLPVGGISAVSEATGGDCLSTPGAAWQIYEVPRSATSRPSPGGGRRPKIEVRTWPLVALEELSVRPATRGDPKGRRH